MNNPHDNAKTTVSSRELIVERYLNLGQKAEEIAAALGISERTVYKWVRRHKEEGAAGLFNRPSKPKFHPQAYVKTWHGLIARLRSMRLPAWQIAEMLEMPGSTVSLALKQLGLNRVDRLSPPVPVIRYERRRPGDMIHLDIKKLRRFDRPGHRVTGRGNSRRTTNAGYDCVHVAIDDHSRVAYVEILPNETGKTCAGFLARATVFFAKKGIAVRPTMTDNGVGYKSHVFAGAIRALGQRHLRTKPYTPQTNGKAERFIKTLQIEWAYARTYQSSRKRNEYLPVWLKYYNHERRHAGIKMKTPISRLH
jgi:transposase InsO family protein